MFDKLAWRSDSEWGGWDLQNADFLGKCFTVKGKCHPENNNISFLPNKNTKARSSSWNHRLAPSSTMSQIICIIAPYRVSWILNPRGHLSLWKKKNECILFAWDTSAGILWMLTTSCEDWSKEAGSLICHATVLLRWQWGTDWLSSSVLCNLKHATNTSGRTNISRASELYLKAVI